MLTDHIVALLIAERNKLNGAIEALQGTKTSAVHAAVSEPTAPKKKRHISAATRRKMALGQQRRHAAKVTAEK
jgi:hypothetical protein